MVSVATAGAANDLAMLRQLESGSWVLRYREGSGVRKMCVRSGLELLALRQIAGDCRRTIVEDRGDRVTVQYSCPGRGYSRTSVRRESETLVQIESQGLEGGVPYTIAAEARRAGSC